MAPRAAATEGNISLSRHTLPSPESTGTFEGLGGSPLKVKAAVARAHRAPLRIEALDLDEPLRDEVLVKLIACGVSQRDVATLDGALPVPLPFVPGGEGAGIVERVGSNVRHLAAGDAVVVTFEYCGACPACRAGHWSACRDFAVRNLSGTRLDGLPPYGDEGGAPVHGRVFGQSSFATHLVCRADIAVNVGPDAPLELLAGLGGELLAVAGTLLHGLTLRPNQCVVVTGADARGLLACLIAQALGAGVVILAEEDWARRERAGSVGATLVVESFKELPDLVRSLAGEGADVAIDFTGAKMAIAGALDSLAAESVIASVEPPADLPDGVRRVEIAEYAPPTQLVEELARLNARGDLPLERLFDFFAFPHVNDAIAALRQNRIAKPVLRFPLGAFDEVDRARKEGAAMEEPERERPGDVPMLDEEV